MSESFEIEFSTNGQSEVVRAFEDLKIKELEAKQQTAALSTELRKLQRAGNASASKVDELKRSIVRAKSATQRYSTEAAKLTRTQRTQGEAVTAGGRKFGELGGALGNVGSVLGNVSPQFGQFGSVMGQVGTAAGALSASMGPIGVALAAVTTAVGIYQIAMQSSREETERNRRANERLSESYDTVLSRMNRISRRNAALARVDSGVGTRDELRARQQTFDNQIERIERQLRGGLLAGETRLDRARTRRMLVAQRGAAERASARLAEDIQRGEETAFIDESSITFNPTDADLDRAGTRPTRGRGGRRQESAEDDVGAEAAQMRQFQSEQELRARAAVAEREDMALTARLKAEHHAFEMAQLQESRQEEAAKARERAEQIAEQGRLAELNTAKLQNQKDLNAEAAQITEGAWSAVGSSMTNFLGQAFTEIQKGNDATGEGFLRLLDAFLEATAIEYTLKALMEGGNAIAAAASYRYDSAVQHGVAAGIYGGVAALAGGAGAAINVPTPSTGAAGQQQVQPAQGSGGAGGQNISINLYSPNAVHTERERGEIMASGVRAARRELGPSGARF